MSGRPTPSTDLGSRLLLALALAGVALVIATLVWFGREAPGDQLDHAEVHAARGEGRAGTRSSEPSGRPTDAANHGAAPAYGAHEALPATLSPDPSPFGALEGKVVDWETRVGIAGAELAFIHEGVTYETLTGADGRYRFEAPASGRWCLATVTAEGFLPYAPELGRSRVVWTSSPGQKLDRADLFLHPAVDYAGEVVDARGRPVAGAQIELFEAQSGERALVGIPSTFVSDEHGTFEFQAPDFAMLEARHPDHPPGRARLDAPAQLSRRVTITMGNAPAASDELISGRVLDAEGAPVAGVEVQALYTRIGGVRPLGRSPITISDDDGAFVLSPLDQAHYVVRASPKGQAWVQSRPVEPGAVVELRLEGEHELEGRLVDEEGAPVVAGTVEISRAFGALRRVRVAGISVFDPQGVFSFGGLSPGTYELQAIAQGRARSQPVKLRVPHEGAPLRLVLGAGASISGRVVDGRSGDPIARAQISVRGLGTEESVLPSLSSAVSHSDGTFELAGITPGRISVEISASDHNGRVVTGVELVAGDHHELAEIALEPVAEGERPTTEITGIGVTISAAPDAIFIREVVPGGGAKAAGIVRGDAITRVEGVAVVELGFESAMQSIRGPAGTTVSLEIRHRDGSREIKSVERRVIDI